MGYVSYLLVPVLIWLFLCACGFLPMILLYYSNFSKVKDAIPVFDRALEVLDPVWLQQSTFRGEYAIRPLGIPMAVFMSKDNCIAMVVYFVGDKRVVDLVSKFPGQISVTTSSTIDGPCAPATPGVFYQSFKGKSPEQLLEIHTQGVSHLQSQLKVGLVPQNDVAIEMQNFVRRQLKYVLIRPWHILTMPYRFAILRFVRMNLTIEQQQKKGIVDIENLRRQAQMGMGQARS